MNFISALLRHGANPNLINKLYNQTPFHIAIIEKLSKDIISLFRETKPMLKEVFFRVHRYSFLYSKEDFEKIDIAMFTTKVFHMYTGEVKLVRMRFMKYLADAVIDRFGEEVMLIPDGEDAFTVTTEVAVSPQFYGWLSGFGSSAEILAPQDVREEMAKHTRSILNLYS